MRILRKIGCCAVLLGSLPALALAAGDAKRGSRIFGQCAACHSVAPGEHLTGPSLARVWNRRAASAEGFARYSEALKHADLVWSEATLDRWLVNPAELVPGTSMTFPGIKEANDRRDLIAYLRAVSEGKAPRPEPGRGGMMMQSRKADLKRAPPAGQVVSIGYCGDTYTVKTADGRTTKVWEFNLRFKTDSSKDGPLPGKPVIAGAGMQGDRASVVFASPREISEFIKPACP
ncbi:MAG TPA: cytochrome c family protein [Burkholderiales bacterium]|nr:cytochrome c family protein [Burkholderiales bacterium]